MHAFRLWKSLLIYRGRPWLWKRKKSFFARWVGPESLCFDIGAHVGDRTSTWLALGARVVSLEPDPQFYAYLSRKLDGTPNWLGLPRALAAEEGRATLFQSKHNGMVSSLSSSWDEEIDAIDRQGFRFDDRTDVATLRLDGLIERYGMPDFMKLDIEGMERTVLETASKLPRALSFEYYPTRQEDARRCIEAVEAQGTCHYQFVLRETFTFAWSRWLPAAEAISRIQSTSLAIAGDVYAERV